MKNVSRRSFVVGATVATAAAGSAVVAQAEEAGQNASDINGVIGETYHERVSGKERFAAEAVLASTLGEPDETCDWLVVGAGNTGLFAAIRGLELGMDTVLLERGEYTGGAGAGTEASQLFNDSKLLQAFGGGSVSFAEAYHYFQTQNSWESNALLVTNYLQNCHGPHDWLFDHGLGVVFCGAGGVESGVGGVMYQGMGSGVNSLVAKSFEQEGGRLYLQTTATNLVVDENGAVVGCLADTPEKTGVYYQAKGVFLGTGGFGTNPDMVEFYIGPAGTLSYKQDEMAGIVHDGSGIRMAFGAGAVEANSMWTVAMGTAAPADHTYVWDSDVDWACREPYLWVDNDGKRLGNENWSAVATTWGTARKAGGYYWNVFDQAAVDRMMNEGFLKGSRYVIAHENDGQPIPSMGDSLDAAVGGGCVFKGDTLEELAEACGIDADGLVATVEHYNQMCAHGIDIDFWKSADCLKAIDAAPFYAVKTVGDICCTLNGVVNDEKLHALDVNGKIIPGLFVGGADASGFFVDEYNHGFGGSCSSFAYFSGWYAADTAAGEFGFTA